MSAAPLSRRDYLRLVYAARLRRELAALPNDIELQLTVKLANLFKRRRDLARYIDTVTDADRRGRLLAMMRNLNFDIDKAQWLDGYFMMLEQEQLTIERVEAAYAAALLGAGLTPDPPVIRAAEPEPDAGSLASEPPSPSPSLSLSPSPSLPPTPVTSNVAHQPVDVQHPSGVGGAAGNKRSARRNVKRPVRFQDPHPAKRERGGDA